MTGRWACRLAVPLLAAALVAGPAGGALAAERRDARLEAARARCLLGIDGRLAAVKAATVRLAGAKHLTDAHRALLDTQLAAASTALNNSRGLVVADTAVAPLADHCRAVAEGQRVYVLVLPKARLAVVADALMAAADRLDDIHTRLVAAVAKAGDGGKDVTAAQADLAALKTATDALRAGADPVAAAVLQLTAADWNANHDAIAAQRNALMTARRHLVEARRAAAAVMQALRRA